MDDSRIFCNYQLFDREQIVYIYTNGQTSKYSVLTSNVGDYITELCYEYGIYNVELYGNSATLYLVVAKIRDTELTNYGLNKIEVHVTQGE